MFKFPSSRTALGTVASVLVLSSCALPPPAGEDRAAAGYQIDAGSLPLVRETDERFQSFQIGMSHLTGGETWRAYKDNKQEGQGQPPKNFDAVREKREPTNLGNTRLHRLTAALAPLYIRYGGTTTNSVYFQDNDQPRLSEVPDGYQTILTRSDWKAAIEFADSVDAKVLTGFTVSSGVRDASGKWAPRMAAPWVAYTHQLGASLAAAELFNEPNAPEPGRMPKGQSAEDFARDFAAFSHFMKDAAPETKLAGPGTATLGVPIPIPSLEGVSAEAYMSASPRPQFDIVSYHFYGALAERCAPANSPVGVSADDALTESWLARPDKQFQKVKALRDQYAPDAPIWLTETGAAACGGTRWQPSFLDTFRYLDTQARLAKQGLDVIVTHALISGSNGVIDEKTFEPNADYWAALLWRKFMGAKVLDAGPLTVGLHVYAHCQRDVQGGVAVLAINLQDAPAVINVPKNSERYTLSAETLQSRTVLLNGTALSLSKDDALPAIVPVYAKAGAVTLPAHTVSFVTLPAANNPSCTVGRRGVP